jgi:hypothetical protein
VKTRVVGAVLVVRATGGVTGVAGVVVVAALVVVVVVVAVGVDPVVVVVVAGAAVPVAGSGAGGRPGAATVWADLAASTEETAPADPAAASAVRTRTRRSTVRPR